VTHLRWPQAKPVHDRPCCADLLLTYPAIGLGEMPHCLEKRFDEVIGQAVDTLTLLLKAAVFVGKTTVELMTEE